MNSDRLVICDRCGSDACFVQEVNSEIKTYSCFGCGFQTNSICRVGSEFLKEQMQTLPELYKELLGEDEEGKVWIPQHIQNEVGIIFAQGSDIDNWNWVVSKYKDVDGNKKLDMKSSQRFEEKDFMDALEVLGIFN